MCYIKYSTLLLNQTCYVCSLTFGILCHLTFQNLNIWFRWQFGSHYIQFVFNVVLYAWASGQHSGLFNVNAYTTSHSKIAGALDSVFWRCSENRNILLKKQQHLYFELTASWKISLQCQYTLCWDSSMAFLKIGFDKLDCACCSYNSARTLAASNFTSSNAFITWESSHCQTMM